MPAKTVRLNASFPVPRRGILTVLRGLLARKRPRCPPDTAALSGHLRRDIGLPPEVRRPSNDPPVRFF